MSSARANLEVAIKLISGIGDGIPGVQSDLAKLQAMIEQMSTALSAKAGKSTLNLLGIDPAKTKKSFDEIIGQYKQFVDGIQAAVRQLNATPIGQGIFRDLTNDEAGQRQRAQVIADMEKLGADAAIAFGNGLKSRWQQALAEIAKTGSGTAAKELVAKLRAEVSQAFREGAIDRSTLQSFTAQITNALKQSATGLQLKIDMSALNASAKAAVKDIETVGQAAIAMGKEIQAVSKDPTVLNNMKTALPIVQREIQNARDAYVQFNTAVKEGSRADAEAALGRLAQSLKIVEGEFTKVKTTAEGLKGVKFNIDFSQFLTQTSQVEVRLKELRTMIESLGKQSVAKGGVGIDQNALDSLINQFVTLMNYTKEEAALFRQMFAVDPSKGLQPAIAAVERLRAATAAEFEAMRKDGQTLFDGAISAAKKAEQIIGPALKAAIPKGKTLTAEFEASIKQMADVVNQAAKEAKTAWEGMQAAIKSGDKGAAQQFGQQMTDASTRAEQGLMRLKEALGVTESATGKLKVGAVQLADGLQMAETRMQSLMTLSYQFTHAGFNLTMFGDALKGVFDKPLEAAKALQEQIGFVNSLFKGGADEMERLRATATELSSSSLFSAEEIGKGMKTLALAGLDMNEVLANVKPVMDFAASGMMNLDEAAKFAVSTTTAYGLELSKLPEVMDILSRAANVSNTDLKAMGTAFEQLGPQAAQLGVSVKETATDLALLSKAGLESGPAATQLRGLYRVIGQLATGTAPKGVQEAFDKMGIALKDSKGNFIGLENVVNQFNEKLKDQSGIDAFGKIIELFKQRGGSTGLLAIMSQQRDALAQNTTAWEKMNKAMEAVAGPEELAKLRLEDLFGKLTELQNSISSLFANIGTAIASVPGFTAIIDGLTGLAKGLSDLINYVPGMKIAFGLITSVIGVLGTVAAAAGSASIFLGIGTAIAGLGGPFQQLLKWMGLYKAEQVATAAVTTTTTAEQIAARNAEAIAAGASAEEIAAAELAKQAAMQRTAAVSTEAAAIVNRNNVTQGATATTSAEQQVASQTAVQGAMGATGRAATILSGILKGLAVMYVITVVIEGLANLGSAVASLQKIKEAAGEAEESLGKVFKKKGDVAAGGNQTAENIRDITAELYKLQQKLNVLSAGNTFTLGLGFNKAKQETKQQIDELLKLLDAETKKFNRDNKLEVAVDPASVEKTTSAIDALKERAKKDLGEGATLTAKLDTKLVDEALKGLPEDVQKGLRESIARGQATLDAEGNLVMKGPEFEPGQAEASAKSALDGVNRTLSSGEVTKLQIELEIKKAKESIAELDAAIVEARKKVETDQAREDQQTVDRIEKLNARRAELEKQLTTTTTAEIHKVGLAHEAEQKKIAKDAEQNAAQRAAAEKSYAKTVEGIQEKIAKEREKLADIETAKVKALGEVKVKHYKDEEKNIAAVEAASAKRAKIEQSATDKKEQAYDRIKALEKQLADAADTRADRLGKIKTYIEDQGRATEITYQADQKRKGILDNIAKVDAEIASVREKAASRDTAAATKHKQELDTLIKQRGELAAQVEKLGGSIQALGGTTAEIKVDVLTEVKGDLLKGMSRERLAEFLEKGGKLDKKELETVLSFKVEDNPNVDKWLKMRENQIPGSGEMVVELSYTIKGEDGAESSIKTVKASIAELQKVADGLGRIGVDVEIGPGMNSFPKEFEQMLAEVRQKGTVEGRVIGKKFGEDIILGYKDTGNALVTTFISPMEAALTDVDAAARKNFAEMSAALPEAMKKATSMTQAEIDAFNAETRRKAAESTKITVDAATGAVTRGAEKLGYGIEGSWDPVDAKKAGSEYAESAYAGMEEIVNQKAPQLADEILPSNMLVEAGTKAGTEGGTAVGTAVGPAATAAVAANPPVLVPTDKVGEQANAAAKVVADTLPPAITTAVAQNPPKLIPEGAAATQATAAGTEISTALKAVDYSTVGQKVGTDIATSLKTAVTAANPIGSAIEGSAAKSLSALSSVLSQMTNKLEAWARSQNITITVKVKKVEQKATGGLVSEIPGMAGGGKLPGYGGGDRRLTLLEDGEYVLPKEVVRNVGVGFLERLRASFAASIPKFSMGIPMMATGGAVGGAGAPKDMGTYTLNWKMGDKTYPLQGSKVVITQLLEQLRREGMTTR